MNTIKRIITSAVITSMFMVANVHAWKRDSNNTITIESSPTSSKEGKLTINCVGRGVVEMIFLIDGYIITPELNPPVLIKFDNKKISMNFDYSSSQMYSIPREHTDEIYQAVQETQQVEIDFTTAGYIGLPHSYLFDWSADYYKSALESFVRRCSAKLRFN